MATRTSVVLILSLFGTAAAQTDPGPRPGPPSAGRPLPGINSNDLAYFQEGLARFREVDSVAGTQPGAAGVGLGPRFNMNSCAGCHAQPTVGGSSPSPASRQNAQVNPQIAVATAFGARNNLPGFIQPGGPVRVVRFARNPDGSPDGGVHNLFVVTGRSDAPGCSIAQPDFNQAVAQNNAFFRIPTPVYGAGLIESIADAVILANLAANGQQKTQMGIRGHENRNGNDGTITRFGWKAQNKSLMLFAGEAYNVEQGVTNELFPNERENAPGCGASASAEDHTDTSATSPLTGMSDLLGLTYFMRYLAPPDTAPPGNPSAVMGAQAFAQIGCPLCHTPSLRTGSGISAALYSDLALHNMGGGLADGITQGLAAGNEWRTAPLWGLGQRVFFLHDGRTSDLVEAIRQHSGQGSEATQVVNGFNALPAMAKQDLINFLRSL